VSDFRPEFPERDDVRRDLEARADAAPFLKRSLWRVGRRGTFLVMMGLLYCTLGYSYGFTPLPPFTVQQLEGPISLARWLPFVESTKGCLQVWGALWIASGATAIIAAWWPPGRDDIGFHALWVFSSVWAVLNIIGEFMGAERAGIVGVIFGIYAITVLLVSGMVDPPPLVKAADQDLGSQNDDKR
jgi:hypothetical protein